MESHVETPLHYQESSRMSARPKSMTKKGHDYEVDRQGKRLKSLKRRLILMTDCLQVTLAEEQEGDAVRREYATWLRIYDDFIIEYQRSQQFLGDEEGKLDLTSYESFLERFEKFKNVVELRLLTQDEEHTTTVKEVVEVSAEDSVSQVQSGTSRMSRLSIALVKAEEEKAEIRVKAATLRERHELEIRKQELERTKLDISMKEQELNLRTRFNIADAKARLLEWMERQSVSSSHKSDRVTRVPYPEPRQETGPKLVESALDPTAEQFYPLPQISQGQDRNNQSEAILSMVRQIKRPSAEIQKFSGDPRYFKRFMRQFHAHVVDNVETDDERLNYLDQYTTGEAHRVVVGYSHLDGRIGYHAARQELETRYGDPEVIANAYVRKALEWPVIRPDDAKALDEFGVFLLECQYAVQNIRASQVLEYSDNLKRIVVKLPFFLHDRWRNIVMTARKANQPVSFSQLVGFVRMEASKARDPTYGKESLANVLQGTTLRQNQYSRQRVVHAKGLATTTSDANSMADIPRETPKRPCMICDDDHVTQECRKLKNASYEKRVEILKSKGLCFACLSGGHISRNCRRRLSCNQCGRQHPTILHRDQLGGNSISTDSSGGKEHSSAFRQKGNNQSTIVNTCCGHMGAGKDKRVAMSILPVKVKSKDSGEAIQTYAMLDSGSTATFCSEQLMRDLRIEGKKTQILLRTMGQEKLEETYEVTGLEVSSLDGGNTIDLPPVWSQAELPVSKTDIVRSEDIERWKYLEGVPLPDIDSDIGLLIGINAPKAMEPHEVIPSEGDGPFAVRTKLGWVVNGPLSTTAMEPQSGTYTDAQVNRIEVIHTSTIQEQLVSQFNYDFSERSIDDVPEYSLEDKKFAKSVTGTIEYKDGHYTIGLPFRKEDIHMPNNRKQAEQRLKLLIRRFKEHIPFYQDYKTFMNNIIQNGYARRVPEKELQPEEGKAWFLPHHGVYHRRKKKMRVVFDCAAGYGGTSLNEQLLSGPNLTNNLVGILLRFRLGYIALLADIEAMFYQVRVPVADAGFLRFLWWEEGDVDKPVAEYQMTVHLFGATSSPSCSVFALLKTAEDNRELVGTTVTNTLHHNFYVDDCLKSVDSVEEAVDLYHNLRRVCNKGGFNLTKWLSNERRIMEIIPSSEWASEVKNVDLDAESLPVERALGVQWRAETDQFEFIVSLKNSPTTRRGILSTVSSIWSSLTKRRHSMFRHITSLKTCL